MKWPWKILPVLMLLVAVGWLLVSTRSMTPEAARKARSTASVESQIVNATPTHSKSPTKPELLVGEIILRDYASPATSPENDLTLLAHLMDNFTLLVKSAADRPLSANEDWAAALSGANPAHERFLPRQHAALDPQGRLVDRWGTPLFFHAIGNHQFELRSAGPDKKLWTADDLHRNADGSFRHGATLNPASLLESTPQ